MKNSPDGLLAHDLALVDGRTAERLTGLKKTARYERATKGTFPRVIALSARCSRYRVGDLMRWLRDPFGWTPEMAIDYKGGPSAGLEAA